MDSDDINIVIIEYDKLLNFIRFRNCCALNRETLFFK